MRKDFQHRQRDFRPVDSRRQKGKHKRDFSELWHLPIPQFRHYFRDLHQNTIYFVENELSGTRYDDDHLKRPRLIIGGKYDGGPTTYYRIDFSGLDGGSKDSFTSDILRNHLYRFTINSVSGPGQETANEADATIPENSISQRPSSRGKPA